MRRDEQEELGLILGDLVTGLEGVLAQVRGLRAGGCAEADGLALELIGLLGEARRGRALVGAANAESLNALPRMRAVVVDWKRRQAGDFERVGSEVGR